MGNSPDADDVVGVTSEEGGTVSRPGEGDTLDWHSLLVVRWRDFRAEFLNADLAFQVPDLDGGSGSSTQPVSNRGENEGVDDVTSVQRG